MIVVIVEKVPKTFSPFEHFGIIKERHMLRTRYFWAVAFVLSNLSNANAQLLKPNWNDFTFRKAKDKWTTDDKGFHAFGSAYLYSVLAKKMPKGYARSEEHTSELQSPTNLV